MNKNKDLIYKKVDFEIKNIIEDDPDNFVFIGYASTFGNLDRGDDIIEKGAFIESLKEMTPKLLWQHEHDEPLGIFTEIYEDEVGLYVKGKMPKADTFVSGRVMPQLKIGSVTSMSIGFSIVDSEMFRQDEELIRKIKKVKLWEISLVTIPMNPQARIQDVKSDGTPKETSVPNFEEFAHIKDVSTFLKGYGLTNSQSNSFIGAIKRIARNEQSRRNEQAELKELIDGIEKTKKIIKENF